MKNLVPLSDAKLMVKTYLENKSKVIPNDSTLPNTETFESEAFVALLKQPDCVKVRLYYGMKENLEICAIIVGVDSNGNEIYIENNSLNGEGDAYVIEDCQRCPIVCNVENKTKLF
jgi:hypothetical protein